MTLNMPRLKKSTGWEPQAGHKYRLGLKIKNVPTEIVSNEYTCPNYFDFGFVPSKNLKAITTPKGKEISITQQLIKFTEQSGNLIIQYLEPNFLNLYDSGIALQ